MCSPQASFPQHSLRFSDISYPFYAVLSRFPDISPIGVVFPILPLFSLFSEPVLTIDSGRSENAPVQDSMLHKRTARIPYPRNRRPYYAVSNRDISQNFSSTRHNTPSVTVSCRIETDTTLAVSSGPVDCPIRQAPLGNYCSAVLKTRLSSVVSCRIEVMIYLFFTADEILEFLFS